MINPLVRAFNWWLAFVAALPFPVSAFYSLCILCFCIFIVIFLLFNLR